VTIKIKFDKESGAFYLRLREGRPEETLEIVPRSAGEPEMGAYMDIDENGNVLGLEFLSLEEFVEAAGREGGLVLPDRIEDSANWEPSEPTRA
jgi:uncharacterized protein YuzE